jgi:hypothetical protein
MTPAEKAELARKHERFQRLAWEKQDQLWRLHERLENDPEGEALREVMRRYCDWLSTLLLYERSELEGLPVGQRLERIKEKRYISQDARAIRAWAEAHFETHGLSPRRLSAGPFMRQIRFWDRRLQPQAWEGIGPPPPGSSLPRQQAYARQREKIEAALVKHFQLEDADLATLHGWLSPATAEWFDLITPDEQRRWVALRLLDVIRLGPPPDVVGDEELAEFFKSKSLTDEERERLMRLPGDEMYSELLQMFRARNSLGPPPNGPGRPPDREPPFDRFERRLGPGGEPAESDRPERTRRFNEMGPGAPRSPEPGPPPRDWTE